MSSSDEPSQSMPAASVPTQLLSAIEHWHGRFHKASGRLQVVYLDVGDVTTLDWLLYDLSALLDPEFDAEERAGVFAKYGLALAELPQDGSSHKNTSAAKAVSG